MKYKSGGLQAISRQLCFWGKDMINTTEFLDTHFNKMSQAEAIELLEARLLNRVGGKVFYANAHTVVTSTRSRQLKLALSRSDLVLADGSGVRWGSAFLGKPLVYNLNGTDLVPALLEAGAKKGLSVYLLGAKPGVAEEAAKNLQKTFPKLVIAGVQDGYFSKPETPQVIEAIRQARPHLLMVAMGVPLQEIWINQHAAQLPGITCMGVGGLFDFLASKVPRAPRLVRATGMEWCWRLAMEPQRMWKRYCVGNLVFLKMVAGKALTTTRVQNPNALSNPFSLNYQDYTFVAEESSFEASNKPQRQSQELKIS